MVKCAFKDEWLKNDKYKAWVRKVPNNRHEAACSYCGGKTFSIASMGEARLREHGNGKTHLRNAKVRAGEDCCKMGDFFSYSSKVKSHLD